MKSILFFETPKVSPPNSGGDTFGTFTFSKSSYRQLFYPHTQFLCRCPKVKKSRHFSLNTFHMISR